MLEGVMKLAIIGTGISGMAAAYILSQAHDVTIYEKNDYIGGHSRTVDIKTDQGTIPVDTGFIVFNKRNYPQLTSLFESLEVPVVKSDMSFGVTIADGWLEYSTASLAQCFAQKRNLVRPRYIGMLRDLVRFHKLALQDKDISPDLTLGKWVEKHKLGAWFKDYFLLPMGGAIWSMPVDQMLDYPAKPFIRFFDNHGLLGIDDAPQWYTVQGGARAYVERLTKQFKPNIKMNCAVQNVIRRENQIEVIDSKNMTSYYDQVVFACHSDQVLKQLSSPCPLERQILGSINYQNNLMVLHKDTKFMPKRKSTWSSWVYLSNQKQDTSTSMSVSYWMNNLQPLKTSDPVIVTLNPHQMPSQDLIYDQTVLEHPVFDKAAIDAQSRLDEIQGKDRIWYCGAWQRYGFHEDGLQSAIDMTRKMGVNKPWG